VTLPQGRNGLSAWRMAVLSPFREFSLCRQVHGEFMRSTLLDLTPIISATVCHQRSYVEIYSRFIVPVQNREKEKDAASSPSYDVSSYVPSCKAGWEEVLRGMRG
jgi:hypothetical protein